MGLKVLITGGDGMLATDIHSVLEGMQGVEVYSLSKKTLDVTSELDVSDALFSLRPHVLIHTAALTNVDLCQENPDLGYHINVRGTEIVARAVQRVNAKMVYISSCGLFGDIVRPYSEDDDVTLKTNYARSKYEGEQRVAEICEQSYIIRPGWLFGGNNLHRRNFVYSRYLEAKANREMKSANDKFGSPTYTRHLAGALMQLIESNDYGLLHVTNLGGCSRYEYVKTIISSLGLDTEVVPVSSEAFIRPAPVPNCEVLENRRLGDKGYQLLPRWEEALDEYVYELKSKGLLGPE